MDTDYADLLRPIQGSKAATVAEALWRRQLPGAEAEAIRIATLEEAARLCEALRDTFLSEQYAPDQPNGSLAERTACGMCARAIRGAVHQVANTLRRADERNLGISLQQI